ncbi:hypothetical protein JTB14_025967 [Gonioctena quinquepunctata]|nr:hypothetical protein JTB14_025967 [Gonioctena quinquepunctata]
MARVKSFDKENVMKFHDIFEKLVDKLGFNANKIFNIDESGYTTVISLKGKKQVSAADEEKKIVNNSEFKYEANEIGPYKSHEVHKYPEESLEKALHAIRENNLGIREASRKYGVPRGTIQDRLHGRVKEGPRKNRISSMQLKKWSLQEKKNPFKHNKPGEKWYQSFLKRQKNSALREAEGLSKARAIISEESIRKLFRKLKLYLQRAEASDILTDPSRIFNGDETSFAMCPKSGKVLAPKGYKNVYEIKRGSEKETITVLLVFLADGKTLTTRVVFPFVRPNKAIVYSVLSEWFIGRSESGCIYFL